MRCAAIAGIALAVSTSAWVGAAPAAGNNRQLAQALHERAMRAAIGRPGVTICRQLQVGIAERDWVRGEVVEVQGHLIAVRIDEPGRFPHILKGVSYHQGAMVWSAPALWTPCL